MTPVKQEYVNVNVMTICINWSVGCRLQIINSYNLPKLIHVLNWETNYFKIRNEFTILLARGKVSGTFNCSSVYDSL